MKSNKGRLPIRTVLSTVVGGITIFSQGEAFARSGREWLEEAKAAAAQKNTVKAVRAYKKAARYPETQDEATLALSRFVMKTGDPKTATSVLEKYNTEKNAFNIDAYVLEAEAAYQAQDFTTALQTLDSIDILHANYAPATELRGIVLYQLKQNDEAIAHLTDYLKVRPDSYRARLIRGKAYLASGKADAALKDFKTVNDQNTKDIPSLILIGDAHFAGNHYAEAERTFRTAIELDPQNASVYEKMATVQAKLNDGTRNPAEMIAFLNKSIELDPNNLEMGTRLAEVYVQRKMYSEAEHEFLRELKINPSYDVAARGLVELLNKRGKFDEVGKMLAQYTVKNPTQTWATQKYVELLLKISRFSMAEKAIKRNRSAAGETTDSFILEANLKQAQGKTQDAIEVLATAGKNRPDDTGLTLGIAMIQEEAGEYGKAVTNYRSIRTDDPMAGKAQIRLALTLEKMGNISESIQTFREIAKKTDKIETDSKGTGKAMFTEHLLVQNKINELEGLVRGKDAGNNITRGLASKKSPATKSGTSARKRN